MRLSTILKILLVLVIALVVAGVVAVLAIDPNDQKDRIAAEVKKATGRDITIAGDIDLNIGLNTALSVNNVTLSNAEWGSRPDMLAVTRLEAEVAILPLLGRTIQVNRLRLDGADILLETDDTGQANWRFGGEDAEAGETEPDGPGDDGPPRLPVIKDVLIQNVTVTLRDGVTGDTQVFELERLAAQGEGPDAPLNLDLAAALNDIPITLNGQLGAPNALIAGDPYPITLAANALGLRIDIDGAVDEPAAGNGIELAFAVDADDLSGLAPLAGDGLPQAGPLEFSSRIVGSATNIALEDFSLNFGATDLAGRVQADLTGDRPRIEGAFTSDQIDLTEFVPPGAEATDEPAPTDTSTGSETATGTERVFPSDPLPALVLNVADADVGLAIGKLITPTLTVADIDLNIVLENGDLSVAPLSAVIAESALSGSLGLATASGTPTLTLDLNGPELDLGKLVQEAADLEVLRGVGALDVSLTGAGDSVAAIMANLDGHARVLMEEGQAKTESFDLFISGLSGVVGTVFGGKEEWTVLECLAADFQFEQGAGTAALLADTNLVAVIGSGGLSLADESLDLTISPQSKSPTLNVAVPINVTGTFAKPRFRPDELATARKVGGIVGGLLGTAIFPPGALLALGDLGTGENSCVATAEAAPQGEQGRAPAAAEDAVEGVKDAIEGIGSGLKNLLNR